MRAFALALIAATSLLAPATLSAQAPTAAPTFTVSDADLGPHPTLIVYGDQRFHDPADTAPADTAPANPAARKALVDRIAQLHPSAVQLSGDLPYHGSDPADYAVFRAETEPWRAAHLRIYPALGNHELYKEPEAGLAAWWKAFPELNGMRWYSVALGSHIRLVQLDSVSSLLDASPQRAWLDEQLKALPPTVDYVLLCLHHPPVADIQSRIEVDHNPRPNELALRDYLTELRKHTHAEFLVAAGHIHNYERASFGGITYLVSGGGGAHPYPVDRTTQDQYLTLDFPNFHYVLLELQNDKLKATMYRLADPSAPTPTWQERDHFNLNKR